MRADDDSGRFKRIIIEQMNCLNNCSYIESWKYVETGESLDDLLNIESEFFNVYLDLSEGHMIMY